VAEGFCASRLGGRHGLTFGTLAPEIATPYLLQRALPA
jgi:hypothetical protein